MRFTRIGRRICLLGLALGLIPGSVRAATVNVTFGNFFFSPQSVTINVGDTVVWTNSGGSHTVTGDGADPFCGTGFVPVSCSHTFDTAGTFTYHCIPHQSFGMTGTIIVQGGGANQPPTVSITSPASGTVVGAPFNGMIQATAADSDGTVAKVDFFANGNLLGTVTQAPFNFQASGLAAGSYMLTAVATDDQGATTTSSPVMLTVDAPPAVSITNPTNGTVVAAPFTGMIQATASDSDGTVARVDFFSNGTLLGSATQSPFNVTVMNLAAGTYSLTAAATDDKGLSTTSSPVSLMVSAPLMVSITNPTNDTLFVTGTNITLMASASESGGSVAQVSFYQVIFHPGPVANTYNLLGTSMNSPYSLTLTNVQPGFIHVVAQATDSGGATNLSAEVRLIVYTPVHFTTVNRLADGTAQLNFTGTSFVIESSPELQSWTPVGDAPTQNADGSWTLVDTQTKTNAVRFYRARHVFNEVLPM